MPPARPRPMHSAPSKGCIGIGYPISYGSFKRLYIVSNLFLKCIPTFDSSWGKKDIPVSFTFHRHFIYIYIYFRRVYHIWNKYINEASKSILSKIAFDMDSITISACIFMNQYDVGNLGRKPLGWDPMNDNRPHMFLPCVLLSRFQQNHAYTMLFSRCSLSLAPSFRGRS